MIVFNFMRKKLRNYLLTGAVVLLPLTVTIYFLWIIFGLLDGWARSLIFILTGKHVYGVGLILTFLLLLSVGIFATNFIGRKVINFWESIILRVPLVSTIYKTTKQIVEVMSGKDERPFRRVVLVEYPSKGIYTVAFQTGEIKFENNGSVEHLICVFVCTTPNPTTGFLVLVPRSSVIYLENSIEDGIRMVLSGGIISGSGEGEKGIILRAAEKG